jgi:hypothetical protein
MMLFLLFSTNKADLGGQKCTLDVCTVMGLSWARRPKLAHLSHMPRAGPAGAAHLSGAQHGSSMEEPRPRHSASPGWLAALPHHKSSSQHQSSNPAPDACMASGGTHGGVAPPLAADEREGDRGTMHQRTSSTMTPPRASLCPPCCPDAYIYREIQRYW